MRTIYVQIASYRDGQLPRTIESCLEGARHPERLRFGICCQHHESERAAMARYLDRPEFRVDAVDYRESRGCCWARNRVNSMYAGEDFTLQTDAHMRFAPWWDEILIDMLAATGAELPILSTYPPGYTTGPGGDKLEISAGIQSLELRRLNRDLTTTMKCDVVTDLSKPGPTHFLAAGLLFTLGRFCQDVPYDPHLYFNGEEINLAVRAFTHGYDFFYPNRNVVWHLYGHGSEKHWMDHPKASDEIHAPGLDRLRELFVGDATRLAPYGLGAARTVADYERLAGLDFTARVKMTADPDAGCFFQQTIKLPLDRIPDRDDYECFIFCLLDADEEEIYRGDIYDPRILRKRKDTLEVSAELDVAPAKFLLWPKSRHAGFEQRMVFDL